MRGFGSHNRRIPWLKFERVTGKLLKLLMMHTYVNRIAQEGGIEAVAPCTYVPTPLFAPCFASLKP